ncbi:integral membrane protein (TIGR00529 family) [Caldanaerobacter subterraneus subsp. tengcongensis MB4]|nr:integral membrane protein (TIGR00529 family) [Caldanaerobacter subterraneus subsp. tengcongensis MB4]
MLKTIVDFNTLFLMITSFAIAVLAELYTKTQLITAFNTSLVSLLKKPSLVLSVIPAVLGLLPIAGGALFSAPVVKEVGERLGLEDNRLIFLNVWFRHVLFMIFPLGQSLLVASITTGYSLVELAAIQIPIAIFMVLVGFIFIPRSAFQSIKPASVELKGEFLKSSLPLLVAIFLSLILTKLIGIFGMPLGVFLGVITMFFVTKISFKVFTDVVKSKVVLSLTFSAFLIMLLQHAILDTGVKEILSNFFVNYQVPFFLLLTIIPGILSALTSSAITGIVMVVPLISLAHSLTLKEASILYVSSFLMYTISPTHLCLIYTARYFGTEIKGSYKYFLPSTVLIVVFLMLYFLIL